MNSAIFNRYLREIGWPELCVSKAEGVYYLLGTNPDFRPDVERCLHVVRLSDLTTAMLDEKIRELTARP